MSDREYQYQDDLEPGNRLCEERDWTYQFDGESPREQKGREDAELIFQREYKADRKKLVESTGCEESPQKCYDTQKQYDTRRCPFWRLCKHEYSENAEFVAGLWKSKGTPKTQPWEPTKLLSAMKGKNV